MFTYKKIRTISTSFLTDAGVETPEKTIAYLPFFSFSLLEAWPSKVYKHIDIVSVKHVRHRVSKHLVFTIIPHGLIIDSFLARYT